jgi:RHS repeat-associated protein
MSGRTEAAIGVWFRRAPGSPTPNADSSLTFLLGGVNLALRRPDSVRATLWANGGTGTGIIEANVGPYEDGQWHYLATSISATTFSLYYDGELVASAPKELVVLPPEADVASIGTFTFKLPDLDLFTFYGRALAPEDVASIFAAQDPFACATEATGQATVSYGYDADGSMVQAGDVSLTRDSGTGRLAVKTLDQVATTIGYNGFGDVTSERTEEASAPDAVYDVTYVRDPLGRVSEKTEALGGQTHTLAYEYDEVGRLLEVVQDSATVLETYTYDDNGNRLSATNQSGSFAATYDAQDRLVTYGPNQYTYRESGELLQKTHVTDGTTSYDYDELGNLLSVALPSGSVVEYEIDAMNRRVGRRVGGQVTHRWVYKDQLNPVAELDASGAMVSLFTYGARSHVPDAMTKEGVRYLFVTDQIGSVRLVVNAETGAVVQQIDYDAWGNVMSDTTPGFQPFGFAGGLYDGQTKLVRFGARDYDPEVGRWTAKDPVLFDGGQSNLYLYVNGDPVNLFDPTGLVDACLAAGAGCLACALAIASGNPLGAAIACFSCGNAKDGFATCNDGDGPECAPPPAGCRLKGPGTGPGNPCQPICDPVCGEDD